MSILRQYSADFSLALGGLFTKANFKALIVLWLPVFLISAFVGLCCVVLPWWLCVAMAGAFAYLGILWFYPWLGLGGYVLIVLIAPDFKLADVATVATMAVMIFRLWVYGQHAPAFPRRLYYASLLYGAFVLLSFVLAVVYFHNKVPNIYRDGRAFLYWLWLPILWHMTAGKADGVEKLTRVLIGIAFTVVALAIFQWITGLQVVATGLVASMAAAGAGGEVTRVQMPGFLFVSLAIIWLALQMLYRRVNIFLGGGVLLVLLAGLYVNFGRGMWFWTFIGMLMPVFFVGSGRALKLVGILVAGGVLVVATLAVVKPTVLDTVGERLLSVKNEGGKRTSYGWRELENHEATLTLQRSPLLGVGMGGEYRPWLHELRLFTEHVRYIHNTYFFVALKLGSLGLLSFLLFYWCAWNGARRGLAQVSEEHRVTLLACLSFFPACLGICITQPEVISPHSVLLFSAVITIFANFIPPEAAVAKVRRKPGLI